MRATRASGGCPQTSRRLASSTRTPFCATIVAMSSRDVRPLLVLGFCCATAGVVLGLAVAPDYPLAAPWVVAIVAFYVAGAWAVRRRPDLLAARRLLLTGVVATAWFAVGHGRAALVRRPRAGWLVVAAERVRAGAGHRATRLRHGDAGDVPERRGHVFGSAADDPDRVGVGDRRPGGQPAQRRPPAAGVRPGLERGAELPSPGPRRCQRSPPSARQPWRCTRAPWRWSCWPVRWPWCCATAAPMSATGSGSGGSPSPACSSRSTVCSPECRRWT